MLMAPGLTGATRREIRFCLVAQTSLRLSRLRQETIFGLPRRGKIFGCVRKPLLRRRVFRSSLAKTRRFAPFTAELMPNMS